MSIAKTTRPYLLTREAAAARIEALEAECDRWAEQANTTAASLRTKVKALEAALRQSVDDWRKRGRRIEALEAALRQNVDDWRKRGRRIEALEAECDRWAEQAETTAASLRTKVKTLEAVLRGIIKMCDVRIHRLSLFDEIQHHARAALASNHDTPPA